MLTEGDPKAFAPALYTRMTRLERNQIDNYYERRLLSEGRGDPRYPDNESALLVARRAFIQGTFVVFFFIRATPLMLVFAAAFSVINGGIKNSVWIGIAIISGALLACLCILWGLRLVEIYRFFAAYAETERANSRRETGPRATVRDESVTDAATQASTVASAESERLAAKARRLRAGILVFTVTSSALVVFPLYHGPLAMRIVYALWFGLLAQVVIWRVVITARQDRAEP